MNNSFRSCIFSLAILSFILFSSCNRQINSNSSTKSSTDSLAVSSTPAVNQVPVDRLFFLEGQLCQHLRQILQDSKGNLWFGTNVYDIMLYDGDSLTYLTEKDGIGGGRTTAIIEDQDGNVWFGMYQGLSKYDGKSFSNYSTEDGLIDDEIWSLIQAQNGDFWIGTTRGVSRFDGEKFTNFPFQKATVADTNTIYAHDRITDIMEDKDGKLWFGTDGFGISIYDGKGFSFLTKENGLPDNNISKLYQDQSGKIWIGTMFGGLSRFDGKAFTNFTLEGKLEGVEVSNIYGDPEGDIWIAIENSGVYRYDGKAFTNYYKDHNLPTNGILCMYKDQEERFWFGGWGGLFRFENEQFVSVTREGPWEK
ncbi:MAG: hypothetical protein MRZ79_15645 [Bacteroidia bacterium]|nr:hypothetical protein [Bacteroidia bacterium]